MDPWWRPSTARLSVCCQVSYQLSASFQHLCCVARCTLLLPDIVYPHFHTNPKRCIQVSSACVVHGWRAAARRLLSLLVPRQVPCTQLKQWDQWDKVKCYTCPQVLAWTWCFAAAHVSEGRAPPCRSRPRAVTPNAVLDREGLVVSLGRIWLGSSFGHLKHFLLRSVHPHPAGPLSSQVHTRVGSTHLVRHLLWDSMVVVNVIGVCQCAAPVMSCAPQLNHKEKTRDGSMMMIVPGLAAPCDVPGFQWRHCARLEPNLSVRRMDEPLKLVFDVQPAAVGSSLRQ